MVVACLGCGLGRGWVGWAAFGWVLANCIGFGVKLAGMPILRHRSWLGADLRKPHTSRPMVQRPSLHNPPARPQPARRTSTTRTTVPKPATLPQRGKSKVVGKRFSTVTSHGVHSDPPRLTSCPISRNPRRLRIGCCGNCRHSRHCGHCTGRVQHDLRTCPCSVQRCISCPGVPQGRVPGWV